MNHHARQESADRMNLVLEGGHDPKVAAATPYAPKELLVLGGAGGAELSVGSDYIHRAKVVHGKPVFATNPADAAPL